MQKNNLRYTFLFLVIVIGISFVGCKKFVETKAPDTLVNGDNVYTKDATAIAVLTGVYSRMSQGSPAPNISSGIESFSLLCGLSADEYTLFSGADSKKSGFYRNALVANATNNIGTDYFNVIYDHIFYVNTAVEGLSNSKGLSEMVKQQLLGEAKFMRAFFYFYLVNLYGDVPLVLGTDYKTNTVLSRTPKADVYLQIIKDIKDAEETLSAEYLDGNLQKYAGVAQRVRPTKWAAKALLARVYLYTGDNSNADARSTEVINNSILYDNVSINNVFLKNSKEAIWQLQPVITGRNTEDSRMFIVTAGFSNNTPVRLSDTLLNSFEPGDQRAKPKNWTDTIRIPATTGALYYYPYKYKNNTANVTEYLMVFRLAEQYLIRAEARAQLGNTAGAVADLNVIRHRAGLTDYSGSTNQASLLSAILHERQVEFFSEWGHRFFDLKRTNTLDALMTVITPKKANGSPWQTYQKLYPISYFELRRGPNLTQNPGYN
ncbi:MAG: RagB/SusD family nutrient uptake outer membrane protein [Chitinophagaceae bacterium]